MSGALGTLIAIFSETIYGLFILCSDLMYVVLFPQLTLILWMPQSNSYGCLAGFFVAFALRLLSGEPVLGLSPVILYPGYDSSKGQQMFPFRTFLMLIGAVCIVVVSLLTHHLFHRGILPRRYDVLKCLRNRTISRRYSVNPASRRSKDDEDTGVELDRQASTNLI